MRLICLCNGHMPVKAGRVNFSILVREPMSHVGGTGSNPACHNDIDTSTLYMHIHFIQNTYDE